MPPPRIAALLGPTASGKTQLAVALRRAGLPVEVVSCDALQLIRGLDAATAKPSLAQQRAVPHHLVDVLATTDRADAGRYARMADAAIAEITARGAWPLLVGGTGLYHRAVVRGLAPLPPSDPDVRAALEAQAAADGLPALHARLREVDPDYAAQTPAANRQRVLRALEVYQLSGTPFSAWHAAHAASPDRYDCYTVVLAPPRERHLPQLEARARAMAAPLLVEAEALVARGVDPASPGLQAIGYREAMAMVRQRGLTPDQPGTQPATQRDALAEILVVGHRRYAKRQRTWFRKTDAALRLTDTDEPSALSAGLTAWFTAARPPSA